MKKVIVGFLVLVAYVLTFATANTVIANQSFDNRGKPVNVAVVKIGVKADNTTPDTMPAIGGAPHVYGPSNLSIDNSRPQFTKFKVRRAISGTAAGDSIRLEYQILPTNNVADTNSTWLSLGQNISATDTIGTVDISNMPGVSIVFKLKPIDVSAVAFLKPIRIVFMESTTGHVDIKH
jgi:hypothetical protein